MKKIALPLFALLVVAGCVYAPSPFGPDAAPQRTPSFEEIKSEFSSNGELIFHTGFNENGERIASEGGPHWIYMHGGACMNCHGVKGKGGNIPHMCTEVAPSITYHDLTEEEHEAHDGEEEHPPYTNEGIKKAITQGTEPDGEELDLCMPRWDMSDEDTSDLIEYLKTL